jgi:glycosyltransferase involved in cell wall biosynthesis
MTALRRLRADRILIALPVFNEAGHVSEVLQAVRRYAAHILVVNDGSTDGTREALGGNADLRLIHHETNLGYGRSLIDAFGYARAQEFTWVLTMDCDRQHEPGCLPCFYRAIARDDADIISGSRYLPPCAPGTAVAPPERVAINRAITRLLNEHLGLHLTDAFCGFKAYRTAALARLRLTDPGYGLPLQLWVQASRRGLAITEIPVPLIYHDGRRNFAGILEDPCVRMEYYLTVLERELKCDVRHEVAQWWHRAAGARRPAVS